MTSDAPARTGLHPSLVLSAYIEPLLRGRRVAVFGDATISLLDDLGKRGARLVHVYDPDGKWVGNFSSVWQKQQDGSWKVIFDGAPPCEEMGKAKEAPKQEAPKP